MIPNHPIRRALWIAAIYLLMSVVLHALRQRGLVSAGTVVRLTGMVAGIVVLVAANAIPKRLVPLERLSCDPAREQALRRLAGWALVLGGLGYTLAYALAPIAIAGKLANSLLAPAGIVVAGIMVYCVWMRVSARRRGT